MSFGTGRCPVTLNRTVARLPVAWTRQVTVTCIICGVDVSSQSLDARIGHTGRLGERFENSVAGIGELAAFCIRHRVELVVMEATGGYERLGFALLWAAGIPAAIVNPRSVRRFAEGMGILEKTDRIDAGVIAWYAEVKAIIAHPPPSEAQARLAALVTRLRQLVETRVVHGNQRRSPTSTSVGPSKSWASSRPGKSPSVANKARSFGRLAFSTATAGVAAGSPAAISRAATVRSVREAM